MVVRFGTNGGKSLCYQLPPRLLGKSSCAVIVSPLIFVNRCEHPPQKHNEHYSQHIVLSAYMSPKKADHADCAKTCKSAYQATRSS